VIIIFSWCTILRRAFAIVDLTGLLNLISKQALIIGFNLGGFSFAIHIIGVEVFLIIEAI